MAQKKNDRDARLARERLRAYQARQTVHERGRSRRRRDNWIAIVGVVVIAAAAVVLQLTYFGSGPGHHVVAKPSASATPSASAASCVIPSDTSQDTGKVPVATTSVCKDWTGTLTLNGDIPLGITLDGSAAPQAVASTVNLIDQGFYTGTLCHRLTTGSGFQVLQCGGAKDLADAPSGGPGYSYGPIENAPSDNSYPAGTIAMARQSGNAYSNGSQFFIVYGDTTIPADDAGGYTVIGKVTSGLDQLVSQIADAGTSDGSTDGAPKVATTITAATVK